MQYTVRNATPIHVSFRLVTLAVARAGILSEYIEISIDISNQVSNNRIARTTMKTIKLEVFKVQGAICIRFYSTQVYCSTCI